MQGLPPVPSGFAVPLAAGPKHSIQSVVPAAAIAAAPAMCSVEEINHVLKLALFFLVIALIAAIFGFTGIASAAVGIAKILFFIFLVIFVVLLVMALVAGKAVF